MSEETLFVSTGVSCLCVSVVSVVCVVSVGKVPVVSVLSNVCVCLCASVVMSVCLSLAHRLKLRCVVLEQCIAVPGGQHEIVKRQLLLAAVQQRDGGLTCVEHVQRAHHQTHRGEPVGVREGHLVRER